VFDQLLFSCRILKNPSMKWRNSKLAKLGTVSATVPGSNGRRRTQEGLRRSKRTAGPSRANEALQDDAERLSAIIATDDGTGFPAGASASSGLGLRIMEYRAEIIGATLSVGPAKGKGTTVLCALKKNQ
jgi:signal transduction histidine kinase